MVDDVTADLPPPDVLQTPAYVALLLAELAPERPTTIVDVGANPINEAPYSGLLHAGACHVIGFEPQAEAYAALQTSKTAAETYYPFAVGTGAAQTLVGNATLVFGTTDATAIATDRLGASGAFSDMLNYTLNF